MKAGWKIFALLLLGWIMWGIHVEKDMTVSWPSAVHAGTSAPVPGGGPVYRLKSAEVDERVRAARELGEKGKMVHTSALAALLRDKDATVRAAAYESLWRIWMRTGDEELDTVLERGVAMMNGGDFTGAIAQFDVLVHRKPEFPEGWNKRATAFYLAGKYQESIADCRKTLDLNPYHFGALFGLGLNYVGIDDYEQALDAFERTLEIMPYSREAKHFIKRLQQVIARKRKKI